MLRAGAAAVDSKGRLFVGGGDPNGPGPALGRFVANGQVDVSFAASGVRNVGSTVGLFNPPRAAVAISIDPADVVYIGFPAGQALGVRKLDDDTFGPLDIGVARNNWSNVSRIGGIYAQAGSVTVVGGWTNTGLAVHELGILQFTSAGELNPAFAVSGTQYFERTGALTTSPIEGVLLRLPDGSWISAFSENGPKYLAKFTSNGMTLDAAFGGNGLAPITAAGGITRVAREPDGKLVIALRSEAVDRVVRFTPAGAVDPTFGTTGVLEMTPYPTSSSYTVAVQADGRILLASANNDAQTSYITRIWDSRANPADRQRLAPPAPAGRAHW